VHRDDLGRRNPPEVRGEEYERIAATV